MTEVKKREQKTNEEKRLLMAHVTKIASKPKPEDVRQMQLRVSAFAHYDWLAIISKGRVRSYCRVPRLRPAPT
jgi:hypothetical protein